MNKKIIITGGCGYIGTVVCSFFLKKGFEVISIDYLKFGNSGLNYLKKFKKFKNIKDNFDNFKKYNEIFKEFDYVIHLASISGMPSCTKFKKDSNYINFVATKRFFLFLKKKKNIKRIIFASSTSVFGNKTSVSNERSSCKPISNYGSQKLNCEKFIMNKVKDKRFIIYRFPTIFGYSPRMRLDLTIHEFARYIFFNKKFEVFNLSSVRPYCDINDLSNILYETIVTKKIFSSQIFCIGNERYNFSKLDIINILKKIIKRKKYNYKITNKIDTDKRNYFVSYNNFKNLKIYNFNENPKIKFSNLVSKIGKLKILDKKKLTSIWYR